jgi:photosystem II stability/assembly factor-like uncharacterized protein
VAFLAGGNIMLRTTDAGDTWVSQNTEILSTFEAVQFLDVNTGFAVGSGGAFVRTSNSGDTWVSSVIASSDLFSVFFLNSSEGFVGAGNGDILKTVDGGITWEVLDTGISSEIRSIVFVDETNAHALGRNGEIVLSLDGGSSWQQSGDIGNTTFYKLRKKPNGTSFAVGLNGYIYAAADVTAGWTLENQLTSHHLYDIAFYSNQLGYAVGTELWSNTGRIFTTQNGGDTWSVSSPGTSGLSAVAFSPDGSLGFMAGASGALLRMLSEPNAVNDMEKPEENLNFSIYPNPATDVLYLTLPSDLTSFDGCILDALGRVVWKKEKCHDRSIPIAQLAAGKYILQLTTTDSSSSIHFAVLR